MFFLPSLYREKKEIKKMKVKVKNRSKTYVGYTVPEDRIHRKFAPNETKLIEAAELEKVTYQPGGQYILSEYLMISDKELAQSLNSAPVEPEYWMDEEQIKTLMTTGSLNRFLDCLDFAPEGVIDTIKTLAVTMPLNDLSKLEAIKNATGFDAAKAIQNNKISAETDETNNIVSRGRRVEIEPVDEAIPAGRREEIDTTLIHKYDVVHRAE